MTRHWGEGSIYKRGTRYWISYSVNGKTHKESGGKTKAEARAKLQARKSEIFHGTFIDSQRAKVSINELSENRFANIIVSKYAKFTWKIKQKCT